MKCSTITVVNLNNEDYFLNYSRLNVFCVNLKRY